MNRYWQKHLKDYKIKVLKFEEVDCIESIKLYEMEYESFDKSIINCKIISPKISNNKLLLNIHGLGTKMTDYYDIIPFSMLGYTVACIDIRGQGGKTQDKSQYLGDTKRSFITRGIEEEGENLYYKNVILDHYYLCKWFLLENGYINKCNSIDLFGGSQGGGLCLMLSAILDNVDKMVIFYPYITDIFNALNYNSDVYIELSKYLKHKDPQGKEVHAIKNIVDNIDPINFADYIKCDILYAVSYKDSSIPIECQLNMYKLLTCKKRLVKYHYHGHEKLPGFMDLAFNFFR